MLTNKIALRPSLACFRLLPISSNTSFDSQRDVHLSHTKRNWREMKLKWAKHGNNVPVSKDQGHIDDPERWTVIKWYDGSPEFGDKYIEDIYYRQKPDDLGFLERFVYGLLGGFFWFYQFYNLYWSYEWLIGHGYVPYRYEFSDEELGIPPDHEPDPEYWGNHGKKFGTYR